MNEQLKNDLSDANSRGAFSHLILDSASLLFQYDVQQLEDSQILYNSVALCVKEQQIDGPVSWIMKCSSSWYLLFASRFLFTWKIDASEWIQFIMEQVGLCSMMAHLHTWLKS